MTRAQMAAAGLLASAGVVLTGCSASDDAGPGSSSTGVSVVATTTIWGDVTGQITGCAGAGDVMTLMPIGADPHDFTVSSKGVAAMARADLVVANGLGLEEGLEAALASAAQDGAAVLEVAPLLDPRLFGGEPGAEQGAQHSGDGHAGDDPHVWLDPARVATAAELIGDRLTDATRNPAFASCGAQLATELTTLDAEVREILGAVPAERRVLVTDHDAFGYFAEAYDFDVAGVVVPGGSTLAKPSSADMAALARTVRETGVPAIFANTANPQALVDALAQEVGRVDVVDLYVGSLGEPGSGADSYQGLMTTNAQRIADALA